MGKKVYIVTEAWDEGNKENIRAAFTNQKKAWEYTDSKRGDWNCYELDLDTEQPDDSMRIWSVEIDINYPEIMHQHDINYFIPRKDTFYMEQGGNQRWIVFFVEANRESKAFEQASRMYKDILGNPEKYKGYSDLHAHFYNNVGDLYDFATGDRIEEFARGKCDITPMDGLDEDVVYLLKNYIGDDKGRFRSVRIYDRAGHPLER